MSVASVASYCGGALVGFALGLLAMLALSPAISPIGMLDEGDWLARNMGHSTWLFALVSMFYSANLIRLKELLKDAAPLKQVAQLDQLSDVWIHVFIGIGVVWTAIGMRSALATTLGAPTALTEGAGQVLSRLVDGGILLALTTTIVGAIGGYLMRLTKTVWLGASLTDFYHREERRELDQALTRLESIESHLGELVGKHTPETKGTPGDA